MEDGQCRGWQKKCWMDIKEWTSAHATTAHNGLLQKRLEKDFCWIIPHVPLMTQSVKGLDWTEQWKWYIDDVIPKRENFISTHFCLFFLCILKNVYIRRPSLMWISVQSVLFIYFIYNQQHTIYSITLKEEAEQKNIKVHGLCLFKRGCKLSNISFVLISNLTIAPSFTMTNIGNPCMTTHSKWTGTTISSEMLCTLFATSPVNPVPFSTAVSWLYWYSV